MFIVYRIEEYVTSYADGLWIYPQIVHEILCFSKQLQNISREWRFEFTYDS